MVRARVQCSQAFWLGLEIRHCCRQTVISVMRLYNARPSRAEREFFAEIERLKDSMLHTIAPRVAQLDREICVLEAGREARRTGADGPVGESLGVRARATADALVRRRLPEGTNAIDSLNRCGAAVGPC